MPGMARSLPLRCDQGGAHSVADAMRSGRIVEPRLPDGMPSGKAHKPTDVGRCHAQDTRCDAIRDPSVQSLKPVRLLSLDRQPSRAGLAELAVQPQLAKATATASHSQSHSQRHSQPQSQHQPPATANFEICCFSSVSGIWSRLFWLIF